MLVKTGFPGERLAGEKERSRKTSNKGEEKRCKKINTTEHNRCHQQEQHEIRCPGEGKGLPGKRARGDVARMPSWRP